MFTRYVIVTDPAEYYRIAYGQLLYSERANIMDGDRSLVRRILEKQFLNGDDDDSINYKVGQTIIKRHARNIIKSLNAVPGEGQGRVLLLGSQVKYEQYGLSKYLKTFAPDVKIVYFFQDLVSKSEDKQWLMENLPDTVDLCISFDRSDAQQYHIMYHHIPYSDTSGLWRSVTLEYDVCFVGLAKGRLGYLIDLCEMLNGAGMRCFFYIVGVDSECQIQMQGVVYGDYMPYSEYLRYVAKSKCLLEVVQDGGRDSTIRLTEAIAFDRLFISNSPLLKTNPLYDSLYMMQIHDPKEIDTEFIRMQRDIRYTTKCNITPESLLSDIDEMLITERNI